MDQPDRVTIEIEVDGDLLDEARHLGIDVEKVMEHGIIEAVRSAQAERHPRPDEDDAQSR